MADHANRVGQQLGNYRLIGFLGQGGFAEVYLGEHIHLGTQAAVKVLHTQLTSDNVEDFRAEARTIAHLVHPHIVRVFDFDVSYGFPFLVMDYCPDGTLRKRHAKGERVPLPTVISYIKQVADALQYAHDQKIIHRDIKPENMLIGQHNAIQLSDFGIAATAHSTSSMSTQAPVGTIPYMAPEQIQAHARPASDQYALGIVAYEWLSGIRPFEGSYTEIFAKHLMTPPPPLLEQVPTLPPEVEQVVMIALAKDPHQRFVSVQAFATALEQASQTKPSIPVPTQPKTVPSQPTPPLASTVLAPPVAPVQTPLKIDTPAVQPLPPTVPAMATKSPDVQTEPQPLTDTSSELERRSVSRLKLTRRRVLVGLAATGVVAAGGGAIWWIFAPHPLLVYRGHSDRVLSVAWSPDGKYIASSSYDQTVQVWDAVDGSHVFTYKGEAPSSADTVAWSPDGKYIASGSWDGTVQVWDAVDGNHVFTYRGHPSFVEAVAWSPDGKRIASGSEDKTVQVWDAVDGRNTFTYKGHPYGVTAVAWSPDGKRIASSSWNSTV